MGLSQFITSTQWYLFGRSHFTASGWASHVASYYVAGELENCVLDGQVFAVTGANSGIGRETAQFLAKRGARVWMICRSEGRGNAARDEMVAALTADAAAARPGGELKLLVGDVSLVADVKKIALHLAANEQKLDGLVCNAGSLLNKKELTTEGVEVTFAAHLAFGCRLLSKELLPLLKAAPAPRCVFVTSGGMYNSKFPGVAGCVDPAKYDGMLAYCYAKRGQVLLAEALGAAEPGVKWVSTHPGWTETPSVGAAFGDNKSYFEPLRDVWQGAEGQVWLCAATADRLEQGALYLDRKPQRKHLSGAFFTDGSATTNTPAEVEKLILDLDALAAKVEAGASGAALVSGVAA